MRARFGFIASALAAFLFTGCPAPPRYAPTSRLAPRPGELPVRIGLAEATGSVRIEADQGLRLVAGETVRLAPSFALSPSRGHIAVNGARTPHNRVTCFASTPLSCNGVPYRGQLEVSAVEGALRVVNIVGLEEYLAGVVPAEIGRLSTREIEAVKAQAIAARTYAVA
ncbi:MAG TPA: SpoIID/LytB domain-containing protein, partial [Candidatus Latescibacteria bacterium]|nr:SpoIID/LytB domain-containing protein [Candidatus Latescibacterota bacterium]